MINVTEYIVREIRNNIPIEVLNEAFIPKKRESGVPKKSIDTYVLDTVVGKRVLHDCNLFGGKMTKISLTSDDLIQTQPNQGMTAYPFANAGVYKVPPEKREHRNITQVIEVAYSLTYGYTIDEHRASGALGGTSANSLMRDVINSQTNNSADVLPTPILLSGNIIKLEPVQLLNSTWLLTCLLEYDKYFTNMGPSEIRPLAELCLTAAKAYIYNKLVIKMDEAFLVNGRELSVFKTIVDSYATAQDDYNEKLLKFRGAAQLDTDMIGEYIGLMFPE